MRKIRFYYDVVCPYSYMETHALEAAEAAGAVDIEWLPFELRPAPSSTPVALIPLVPRAD
jgi:predicted DsbA family dithiol-disulfide isomerase